MVSNSLPPTLSLIRSPTAEVAAAAGFRPFIDGGLRANRSGLEFSIIFVLIWANTVILRHND